MVNTSEEPIDGGPSSYTVSKSPGLGTPLSILMPELDPEQSSQIPAGFEGYFKQRGGASPTTSNPTTAPSIMDSPKGSSISPALAQLMSAGSLDKIVGIDFVLA